MVPINYVTTVIIRFGALRLFKNEVCGVCAYLKNCAKWRALISKAGQRSNSYT